jgi:hypothetical protein
MLDFADVSDRDLDVLRTLHTTCELEKRTSFTADDIFLLQLDRFFPDVAHGVGGFFARLQHNGLIEQVGWKRSTRPSNHLRQIREYKLTEKGLQMLHCPKEARA